MNYNTETKPPDTILDTPNAIMVTEVVGSLILIAGAAAIYVRGFLSRANEKENTELEATKKLMAYQEERIIELEQENRRLRQAMELSGSGAPTVTQQRIYEIKETLGAKHQ